MSKRLLSECLEIEKNAIDPRHHPDEIFYYYTLPNFDDGKIVEIAKGSSIESNKFIVNRGSVLISKLNPRIKRVWMVVNDGNLRSIASTEFLVAVAKNFVDADYLFYVLQSDNVHRKLECESVGTTNSHTRYKPKALYAIEVEFPAQSIQGKIARILQTIDRAIEKTEALIDKYQQIKAGLMHDLFTRGIGPDGQLRPPRKQAPELYQETPIGWVPKEWNVKVLSDACDWFSGGTPSKSREDWWQGDIPWLSPKDMKKFELSDTEHHLTNIAAISGSRVVPAETVFIVVRGMILAHSFPVVISSKEFAFNQDVKAIIARGELANRYLAYWFVSNKNLFLKKTTESTHGTKRFDLRDIYAVTIGIPSVAEQDKIVNCLDTLESMINSTISQREKLQLQKNGLMHDLLTGKVPVQAEEPEAEPEAAHV